VTVRSVRDDPDDGTGAVIPASRLAAARDSGIERSRVLLQMLTGAERAGRVGAFVDRFDRPDGLIWTDTLYSIMGADPATGPTRATVLDAFPPSVRELLRESLQRMVQGGDAVEYEVPLAPADGRAEWVRLRMEPRFENGRCIEVSGAVQDISDRKRLELDVLRATDSERERIGADLHDDIGQLLTAVGLQAVTLRHALCGAGVDDGIIEAATHLERTVSRTREACRRLARNYATPQTSASLLAMLEQLAGGVPAPMRCTLRGDTLPGRTPPATTRELYRIAQEAVANAIRHSQCTSIVLDLTVTGHRIVLSIEDDGVGVSEAHESGLGLAGMRARAARVTGVFAIQPGVRGGTRIVVSVPLTSDDESDADAAWAADARGGALRLAWRAEYACGEPTLDRQHRELFEFANELIDAASGASPDLPVLRASFDRLIAHADTHFRYEEDCLVACGYERTEAHVRSHAKLLKRALELRESADAGQIRFGAVVDFLANELVAKHLLRVDRDFFPRLGRAR
jgi:hemerythrin-like metal-binding protein